MRIRGEGMATGIILKRCLIGGYRHFAQTKKGPLVDPRGLKRNTNHYQAQTIQTLFLFVNRNCYHSHGFLVKLLNYIE